MDDLIEDKRFPFPVRHLRRIYRDPMTRRADWETTVVQGGIVAIHSRSHATPLRQNVPDYVTFQPADADKATYADWIFARKTISSEANPPVPSNANQPRNIGQAAQSSPK
ncbi:MAG TPA: hypothetical protein VFW00_08995, partial [Rhodocyclaceae bacterium]|nr:hypothetical protein [Rhodocyclaceae bacterium]